MSSGRAKGCPVRQDVSTEGMFRALAIIVA